MHKPLTTRALIRRWVEGALAEQPVTDIHTHLYSPAFGTPVPNPYTSATPQGLMLWGIDRLLTYHYLVAELFRVLPPGEPTFDQFAALRPGEQAELVWEKLFIEHAPVSEACRGVLTTLQRMGLDTSDRNLDAFRSFYADQHPDVFVDKVMQLAGVESITMTNDVFDDNERRMWLGGSVGADPRFKAVLRIDPLLIDWPAAAARLNEWDYPVSLEPDAGTIEQVQRFCRDWLDRMKPIYVAVSLPPDFTLPPQASGAGQRILAEALLPVLAERKLPFAMMIGVVRGINPKIGPAGDMGFASDVRNLTALLAAFPQNKFLVTMLSRENQHELAVAARKFSNLMIFGCWWFLNNPSLVDEITRMRFELLGTSFIPQHSDARVLDQLVYKWDHSRRLIAHVLTDKYCDLAETGWHISRQEICRDIRLLVRDNFQNFLDR